jgi:hypothetical protein
MTVYTVMRQDKIDYDCSVLEIKWGCFAHKENAIARVKEIAAGMIAEFAAEIEKYSDKEKYPDGDSGAVEIEIYDEYFCIRFGLEKHYEIHSVYIDDWEVED